MHSNIPSGTAIELRRDNPVWALFAVTFYHVVGLTAGFFILVVAFDFPDILREPAIEHLTLFADGFSTIVPTYYLLALTGLTQAVLAVLIWLCAPKRDEPMLVLAGLFGVLCGAFQIIGFIRWPIVISYLADTMAAAPDADTTSFVTLIEGVMNRYAGMAISEHLGFISMALWTFFLGVAVVKQPFIDRRLGWTAIGLGIVTLAMAAEPLGGPFTPLGELTGGIFALWTIWLMFVAVNLVRFRHGEVERRDLPRWILVAGLIYAAIALVSTYAF